MRLIDADAVYPWYLDAFDGMCEPNDIRFSMNDIKGNLDNIPTVEPKRGKWIKEPQFEDIYSYRCSECLKVAGVGGWTRMWFKYCPNCGAKMEAEE